MLSLACNARAYCCQLSSQRGGSQKRVRKHPENRPEPREPWCTLSSLSMRWYGADSPPLCGSLRDFGAGGEPLERGQGCSCHPAWGHHSSVTSLNWSASPFLAAPDIAQSFKTCQCGARCGCRIMAPYLSQRAGGLRLPLTHEFGAGITGYSYQVADSTDIWGRESRKASNSPWSPTQNTLNWCDFPKGGSVSS